MVTDTSIDSHFSRFKVSTSNNYEKSNEIPEMKNKIKFCSSCGFYCGCTDMGDYYLCARCGNHIIKEIEEVKNG